MCVVTAVYSKFGVFIPDPSESDKSTERTLEAMRRFDGSGLERNWIDEDGGQQWDYCSLPCHHYTSLIPVSVADLYGEDENGLTTEEYTEAMMRQ